MQRRELFNILFKNNQHDAPIVQEPDPILETPSYLQLKETAVSFQEWIEVPQQEVLNVEPYFEHAFTVKVEVKSVESIGFFNQAKAILKIQMGIKTTADTHSTEEPITLGLDAFGKLFIGDQQSEKALKSSDLSEGIQFILEVNPQANGRSYAKVKLLDHCGLTLFILKSNAYFMKQWAGNISYTFFGPPLNLKFLRIEGHCSIDNELSNHKIAEL